MNKNFRYVPSKKLVFLSFILVFVSIFFAFQFFDTFSLLIYFLITLITTLLTAKIKINIYTRAYSTNNKEETFPLWPLILLVAIGLFAPFLLLFLLSPLYVLILIDAYVAGVNLPEILFFFYRLKSKQKRS